MSRVFNLLQVCLICCEGAPHRMSDRVTTSRNGRRMGNNLYQAPREGRNKYGFSDSSLGGDSSAWLRYWPVSMAK